MPKTIAKPKDKRKALLLANIDYECEIRGIKREQRRLIVQCSQPTYDKKRKDPGQFTVDELYRLADKFKISVEDLFVKREVIR